MKQEDIAKSAIAISGGDWEKLNEETREEVLKDIGYIQKKPDITPAEFHKLKDTEEPYSKVKPKQKEIYKVIIATVKSLSALKSDEKGDFVECNTVESGQEPAHHPNRAVDWSHKGLNLRTVSTPKGKSENM